MTTARVSGGGPVRLRDVSSTTLRNIGIILLLALAVFALPGGGTGASIVSALIGIAFSVAIWMFLMRSYREHRMTIFALGDQHRGILYASLAALMFCGASAQKWWQNGPLTVLWLVLAGAAVYGLVTTYRHWRAYV
jgi:hypothetical protein